MRTNHPTPLTLGVTGGMGSGKSYVCRMLEQRGIPVFYTDPEAKLEMKENDEIHQRLTKLVGPGVIAPDGTPVRDVLSAFMRQSPDHTAQVNAIVHPRVRLRAQRWQQSQAGHPIVAIESALLFTSDFDQLCQATVTVTAPLDLRIDRICRRDNTTCQTARQWIGLQMSQEQMASLSDHTIVNDGVASLDQQIEALLDTLRASTK